MLTHATGRFAVGAALSPNTKPQHSFGYSRRACAYISASASGVTMGCGAATVVGSCVLMRSSGFGGLGGNDGRLEVAVGAVGEQRHDDARLAVLDEASRDAQAARERRARRVPDEDAFL